jgi:hypothetical protein
VQIECAVTIQDAQQVAEAYGMQYPEKSQYVRIGDALPFGNVAPASTDTPVDDTATQPETTPDTTDGLDTSGGEGQPPAGG